MSNRAFWFVIGVCLVVFFGVIPVVAPDHRIDVLPLAIRGGVLSILSGALGAAIWIARSHGRPFGFRDLDRDRTSPYLRESRRWAKLTGVAVVVGGLVGSGFAVYWYPNPHPDVGRKDTPEQYALGVLVGAWFVLVVGTYLLVLETYWSWVLRRDRSTESSPLR